MVYENVMDYCKENNLTIHSFEKKCGIGNGVIAAWKDGNPSLDSLNKIVKATGIPLKNWL